MPHDYLKGDYDIRKLVKTSVVEGYGGRWLAIAFVDGYSTTALGSAMAPPASRRRGARRPPAKARRIAATPGIP